MSKNKSSKVYEIKAKPGKKVAYIDESTGEIEEVKPKEKPNNGKVYNNPNALYKKAYKKSWQLLGTQLTEREYVLSHKLSLMAHEYTNSLKPLTIDMSASELSRILSIPRKKVKVILDKLLDLGVIARFTVSSRVSPNSIKTELKDYLIFNPYLSFSGQVIDREIKMLFEDTNYAAVYKNNLDPIV